MKCKSLQLGRDGLLIFVKNSQETIAMRPRATLNASQSVIWAIFLLFSIFCVLEQGKTSLPKFKNDQ